MKVPTEAYRVYTTTNGKEQKVRTHSYVITLTERGGSDVKAVRLNGFASQYDRDFRDEVAKICGEQWSVKGVQRLYEDDFDEEGHQR